MASSLEPGVYEDLITNGMRIEIEKLSKDLKPDPRGVDAAEIPQVLSRYVNDLLTRNLESLGDDQRNTDGVHLINRVITEIVSEDAEASSFLVEESPKILAAVSRTLPDGSAESIARPLLAFRDTTLLTNARGEPSLLKQLESEFESARSVDILMAFVHWAGVRTLIPHVKRLIDRGGVVRLMTTTYLNSTEQRALDGLVQVGAQVKVSYDISQTRLHAKSWLFDRDRGLSTAFVGSSNMSSSAMGVGQEWNIRISEISNADTIRKFKAVFESYWQSSDYKPYDPTEFGAAVQRAEQVNNGIDISPFLIEPKPFQQRMLEDLQASRNAGFHRNLVVAATGTGKTVMSAFDYKALALVLRPARLLFIAHRNEILSQSRKMFAQILQDPNFGEFWVDGKRPSKFDHIFASIQTLAKQDIESIEPDFYDVIIIDEAHHVAASSYQRVLRHFRPKELVGLTATPERGDGRSILQYFDDRIAAELRIWEAIEQGYLCPFAYFGIGDGTDLSTVRWTRGAGYDVEDLTNVYTANHYWISQVIQQVQQKILDPSMMRALGFCVGVKHAQFVAEQFNRVGIKSVVLTGDDESPERAAAISRLTRGEIQAIFTVDLFNEGIDIPSVDTLLLFRPTDSALLFLQQIGRGLRKSLDKQMCTILDFVGSNRDEFRYENRFKALVGGTRRELEQQVVGGFPLLPAGCQIHLDPYAQAEILESLKRAVPSQWLKIVNEFKSLGDVSLRVFLAETRISLEDFYARGHTYAELRRDAGFDTTTPSEEEVKLLRGVARLDHIDDSTRLQKYREWLAVDRPPMIGDLSVFDRRLARMMSASITSVLKLASPDAELELIWKYPAVRRELENLLEVRSKVVDIAHLAHSLQPDVPLRIHALYSRTELQAALDDVKSGRIKEFREGVRYIEHLRTDIFLFTADKSTSGFSPTTRYRDYAISSNLIHWQSQSTTSPTSPTGKRYITHQSIGTTILLFGRHSASDDAYWFLGPAEYVTHSGEYPITFTWKLKNSLPVALFSLFAAA
jgi:superfamily II DNA or RNA helicase/HKD family nuclease